MVDKTENIKASILFSIVIVGLFLIVLFLMGAYQLQKNAIEASVHHRISSVQSLFQKILQEESRLMNGQIDFIKSNSVLRNAFIARERSELYQLAQPLFERMRSRYKITHFYFHDKNQVCFLRVHFPDRYGDLIGRFTMKKAVATEQPFYGIELGPLGTFALRTVHPWIIDGKLEGYIELGMEIEHTSRIIKQVLDLDILVLIEKKFLSRKGWEDGLEMLNRKGNWDLFHDFIIIDRTMQMSSVLDEKLQFHSINKDHEFIFTVSILKVG